MNKQKNLLLTLTILISSCSDPKVLVDENKIIPSSVFLAEGSDIIVRKGSNL